MSIINGAVSNNGMEVDSGPSAGRVVLYDQYGAPLTKTALQAAALTTDRFMQIAALNDQTYRPVRNDRTGGFATAKFTPLITFDFFTAALPPTWLSVVTTQTMTYATTSGALLNASAIGTASSNASLISMQAAVKYQKSPIQFRSRAKLVKGGVNGQADWGLIGSQAPGSAAIANGFVFLFGADGTLKPTYYINGAISVQGTDFASLVNSANYYVWDIVLDDDSIRFICQDASTGSIVNEQVLQIPVGDVRLGLQPYFFAAARTWVTASANVGAATQLYVADLEVLVLDLEANRPWPHVQAATGKGGVVNPTIALTQLANYANTAAPASASLSNTTAGYTTLGGQFQYAAVAGAETDYALFAWQVPTGVKFVCTGIAIDTMNTGAAVATTATWLQWFLDVDSPAVTLASNSFRATIGNQVFAIGAAIGAQAQVLSQTFATPYVTNSGRYFKIGLKNPLGTATASQIIRGVVRVEGYFE